MFKQIGMLFGFLTRIKVKTHFSSFEEIARKMWLFPIVGAIIGIFTALLWYGLSWILPDILIGILLIGFLLLITGTHHTDGLLDFGDGIMVLGDSEKKINVMHDTSIGAGGFAIAFVVLIITAIAYSTLNSFTVYYNQILSILVIIVTTEVANKFSMVLACSFGKSVKTKMASKFIELNSSKDAIKSYVLSIILIGSVYYFLYFIKYILFQDTFVIMIVQPTNFDMYWELLIHLGIFTIVSVFSAFLMMRMSNKHFGGVTGDVLGALHEITRAIMLLTYLIWLAN